MPWPLARLRGNPGDFSFGSHLSLGPRPHPLHRLILSLCLRLSCLPRPLVLFPRFGLNPGPRLEFHPQDSPDCEDSRYTQDAQYALDSKADGDAGDPRGIQDTRESKKEVEILNDEADIVRVAALDRVKDKDKANERAAKEVLAKIRARMEAEQSERKRVEL